MIGSTFKSPNSRSIVVVVIAVCLSPTVFAPVAISVLLSVFAVRSQRILVYRLLQASPFFFFIVIACIQLAVSLDASSKLLVDIYRWTVISLAICLVPAEDRRSILGGFYAFFVVTVLYCIIQQLIPQNQFVNRVTSVYVSEALMDELFIPGFVRSTGFNQGPGHVGLVALMGCIVARALFGDGPHRHRWVIGSNLAALSVMFLAAAKGALLAYAVYLILHLRVRYAALIILAIIMLFQIFAFNEDIWLLSRLAQLESASERFIIWTDLLQVTSQGLFAIIFGHGRVGTLANASIFDSDWVFLYLTQGIIGVATVLALIFSAIRLHCITLSKSLGVTVALILAGLSNPFLTDIKFGALYWALIFSLAKADKNKKLHCHN